LAISIAAIANRGGLSRAAHRATGLVAPRMSMVRPAAVGFNADKVIRAGGLGGIAVFVRHGTSRSYPRGFVVGACALAAAASLAALGMLLSITLALLAVQGRLTGWWLAAGGGFVIYVSVVVVLVAMGARRRDLVDRVWSALARRTSRGLDATEGQSGPVDDVFSAFRAARHSRRWAGRTLGHAALSKALGAAMLYCAANAVGAPLTATGAIVIYAAALGASMASLTPAGLGVVEASTGALLVSAGSSVGTAAMAVALYRLFDLWIPVMVGLVLSRPTWLSRAARARARVSRGVGRPSDLVSV
jgi:uncharacterized membrane protein YbhN (UPF0104 family)